LKQNKQKCYLFSFTKSGNRMEEQVLPEGVVASGEGRKWGKGMSRGI
jgi:hypothetical protein